MTATKAPDAGWARLSAGIIHDPDWLDLDAAGRLVFVTGIALAKAANRDGELSLRAMTGVMVGALTTKQVERAAADLVTAGLWDATSHPDRYVVSGFLRWNESTADQEGRRARKVTGAHRTNHQLGRHTEPKPDCPDCTKRVARANAIATAEPNAIAVAIDRSDADETLTRRDETPPAPSVTPGGPPEDAELVLLADQIVESLGIVDAVANQGERNYVARALAQGWTGQELLDEALVVGARDEIRDHRAYLGAVLKRFANEAPGPATAGAGGRMPERRGLLDDERAPCTTCDGSGMVGGIGDDGRPEPVTLCPGCHALGAVA